MFTKFEDDGDDDGGNIMSPVAVDEPPQILLPPPPQPDPSRRRRRHKSVQIDNSLHNNHHHRHRRHHTLAVHMTAPPPSSSPGQAAVKSVTVTVAEAEIEGEPDPVSPPSPPSPSPTPPLASSPSINTHDHFELEVQRQQYRLSVKALLYWVGKGEPLRKHGREGAPHTRWLSVSVHKGRIMWNSGKLGLGFIEIRHVKQVVKGRTTDVFKRKKASKVAEDVCFSIIATDRTLDLECKTMEQRDQWVRALQWVIDHVKKQQHNIWLQQQRASAARQQRKSDDRFQSLDMRAVELKHLEDEDMIHAMSSMASTDPAVIRRLNMEWQEQVTAQRYERTMASASRLQRDPSLPALVCDDAVLTSSPKRGNHRQPPPPSSQVVLPPPAAAMNDKNHLKNNNNMFLTPQPNKHDARRFRHSEL